LKAFGTILADPPWDYDSMGKRHRGRSPRKQAQDYYQLMTMAELSALSVEGMAKDNAHLYLWATNAFVHEALHLMEDWGFRYINMITWAKDKIGMGWYFRGQTEQLLFGVRGSAPIIAANRPSTLFPAPRMKHSQKPDSVFDVVQTASPGPYLELFGRKLRPGWTVWGDEVGVKL